MERIILHSDINNCYASVECLYDATLRGKPVAVGGSAETRHGIVLAKSEQAKRCGVQTGETLWQARQKCRELVVVPPHYERYLRYSRLVRAIYRRYTDCIEPFGLDEAWLDVTGSSALASGTVADEIRRAVRRELGLTVSVGVSFNKIFAKLGSDLKKPDAVTVIDHTNFREKIWNLPVDAMLGCGRATARKLRLCGVQTIGQLASCDPAMLQARFGKAGETLWLYANGLDCSRVRPDGEEPVPKSVGHGATCVRDLHTAGEVWLVLLSLTQEICKRLHEAALAASAVQVSVKNNLLFARQFQSPLPLPTQSAMELARAAFELFCRQYRWEKPVRAVSVRAFRLQAENMPVQTDLFTDFSRHSRQAQLDETVLAIRRRYGRDSIFNASLLSETALSHAAPAFCVLPGTPFCK
ncbi:MAG TPA: DNA polymerase IV [Candidatus Fimenecus excrementigallinarum]|uniref:DNA polymerase IV n=1 Tax=Candidatus Fimenecus excrementigallinarum TaxID=2840816 RepID=A0A9D1IEC9_9FIRM|nr:DNA polymerase IV [Candidatus Fimenecus excrementigallinarum]